ncbi:MAG: DUF5658 family protein [Phycisphaerales bacterium JB060]
MTQSAAVTATGTDRFSDALGPASGWKPRWIRLSLREQWANPTLRARRVNLFLLAIVFLSLADLSMTLDHMVGPGMYESNPLARFILQWGTPATLAMFKCMTLLLGTWLLWRTRKSLASEVGAIICMAVLTWLMFRWNHYSNEMTALTPHLAEIQVYNGDSWVAITSDP